MVFWLDVVNAAVNCFQRKKDERERVVKARLSGISRHRLTHPDFGNSAEEFRPHKTLIISHPHETLSTPMKLLSSLFINIVSHQYN
jgi:hypothetical protein